MNGREKSDPAIVVMKPTNDAGRPAEEAVERRAGAEGNADQQSTHRTQADPGACDPSAGPRTASGKAKEEGAVHRAPPPRQSRHAPAGVLRAKAQGRPGRG